MPLPLTGPLSILNIRNGFTTGPGGTDAVPHQLGEFYAGGVYVPSGTTGTNGAIPSTVGNPISISDFYGAPGTTEQGGLLSTYTSVDLPCYASFTLVTDGTTISSNPTGNTTRPAWYSAAPATGIGSSYEMKWIASPAPLTPANIMPGTEGVWQSLSTAKLFRNGAGSGASDEEAIIEVYIRAVGDTGPGKKFATFTIIYNYVA